MSDVTSSLAEDAPALAPKSYPTILIKPEFPEAVRERLQQVDTTVQSNAAKANADLKRRMNKLGFGLESLSKLARSGGKHRTRGMNLLRDLARVWAHSVAQAAACKEGCTACCHGPVPISAVEAKVIGKAIKRHPATVSAIADTSEDGQQGGAGAALGACPFLVSAQCAIYKDRPLLCRTRFNLDADALLCDAALQDQDVPVPVANAAPFHDVYRQLSADAEFADIRAFFPRGLGGKAV